jgi:ATP-dependent DNA helicase RecG
MNITKYPEISRYYDYTRPLSFEEASQKTESLVYIEIERVNVTISNRLEVVARDLVTKSSSRLYITFYHYGPFHLFHLTPSNKLYLYGSVKKSHSGRSFYMHHPQIVPPQYVGYIIPAQTISESLKNELLSTSEYLPEHILETYNLMPLHTAIRTLYFPSGITNKEKAIERLILEEILSIFNYYKKDINTLFIPLHREHIKEFTSIVNLTLTQDQTDAIEIIFTRLTQGNLDAILIGDVGTGKTIVAFAALWGVSILHGFKSFLLAPSVILAHQHYKRLKQYFKDKVGLFTSEKKENPDANILVGTHALLHTQDAPALTVIDEQHAFGVQQQSILQKYHILRMTATPLPRTFAQILSNLCDVIYIKEYPYKRDVTTYVVQPDRKEMILKKIQQYIKENAKVMVVYPFIEYETTNYKSLKHVAEFWMSRFPEHAIFLHGKMDYKEKIDTIEHFRKDRNLLISTSLIESGLDIPDVTLLVVVGAEQFGLLRLHQLRGRVGRGGQHAECFFIIKRHEVYEKFKPLEYINDNMEIVEMDSYLRGFGNLTGNEQKGNFLKFFDPQRHFYLIEIATEIKNLLFKQ